MAYGRIKSVSTQDYRRIFGDEPPKQEPKRVIGKYFRKMVKLWIFLNNNVAKKDLYIEFNKGRKSLKKIDYRIFCGKVKK